MHYRRKGSFGISPARSKSGTRWSGLLLSIFFLLLLSNKYDLFARLLPTPNMTPMFSACPIVLPNPPLHVASSNGFSWRNVKQNHPVETFTQFSITEDTVRMRVQHEIRRGSQSPNHRMMQQRRQAEVRAIILDCWNYHKQRSQKLDSSTSSLHRGSRAFMDHAVFVDSLDLLQLIGMQDEAHSIIAQLDNTPFTPGEGHLDIPDLATRYLGGLLSAYDISGCQDDNLLQKAMQLGEMLYLAFDTPVRLPTTCWSSQRAIDGKKQDITERISLAQLASFSLPFSRLSQITGDMRYYDAAKRLYDILEVERSTTRIPGIWPTHIDLRTLDISADSTFNLHDSSNSVYDNLVKTFQLLRSNEDGSKYRLPYVEAVDAIIEHMLFRPVTPSNADILVSTTANVFETGTIVRDHSIQHSACSVGAMLALGSKVFSNTTQLAYAQRLTEGCIWAYTNAPNDTGIMPEAFTMLACASASPENNNEDCSFDATVWPKQAAPGFERILDESVLVRPEAIESVFYMYRITGENRYLDIAWEMWQSAAKLLRKQLTEAEQLFAQGYGEQEAFLTQHSRTMQALKYYYLIFSDPQFMSLDDWVFSPGGHPFRLSTR